jgi:hypothetical protein
MGAVPKERHLFDYKCSSILMIRNFVANEEYDGLNPFYCTKIYWGITQLARVSALEAAS